MQGEPQVVASSHRERAHNSPTYVDLHSGEHTGRLSQQTQSAEVGLQTSPIGVLENLPETTSLAHTGCIRIQEESPNSQVHDLGGGLQGNGNQCPGFLLLDHVHGNLMTTTGRKGIQCGPNLQSLVNPLKL